MQLSIDRKKLLRGLLLLLLSLFFLKLCASGNIHLLVSDTISVVIACTSVLVMVLSIAIIVWSIGRKQTLSHPAHAHENGNVCEGHNHNHNYDHEHNHVPASSFWGKSTVCLLLLSLLAAFSWYPRALGSEMIASSPTPSIPSAELNAINALNEGSNGTVGTNGPTDTSGQLNPPATTQNTEAVVAKQKTNEDSQASFAIDYQANPKKYVGTSISLEGFVYHSPMLPPDYFILTRYFVFCCIADAYPIGITVRTSHAMYLKNDTWVQVTGTIDTKQLPILDQIQPTNWFPTSPQKPVIISSSIKQIPTPAKPYMMPI